MRQVYRQKAQGTVTHKRDPQNNTGIGQDISNDERMPTESLQTRRQWNTLARVDRIMPVIAGQANVRLEDAGRLHMYYDLQIALSLDEVRNW